MTVDRIEQPELRGMPGQYTKEQTEFKEALEREGERREVEEAVVDQWLIAVEMFGVLRPGVPSWEVRAATNTIRDRVAKLLGLGEDEEALTRSEAYDSEMRSQAKTDELL